MTNLSKDHVPPNLKKSVEDALRNIAINIKNYVYDGERSTYSTVAVELRKLLLDHHSVESFGSPAGREKGLFETCYGNSKHICIQSFLRRSIGTGWSHVAPTPYVHPLDIVNCARQNFRKLVCLSDWLEETPFHDRSGSAMKVRTVIQEIADWEGAHIISQKKRNRRVDASLAVIYYGDSSEMSKEKDTPYIQHWEQFIIDAGVRLLLAQKKHQGQTEPLFREMEPLFIRGEAPTAPIKIGNIQMKRH